MISLVLVACSGKTLDARNIEVVNGKLYQRGENSPFSGAVTNVANGLIFSANPGFEQVSSTVGKAILYSEQISSYDSTTMGKVQQYMMAIGMHPLVSNPDTARVLCDVQVRDGLLDGAVKCTKARSEDVVLEATMSGGQLNGELTAYRYENGTRHVALTAGFKDGKPDGKEEVYSRRSDKLIHRLAWSNGVAQGTEEAFDDRTGKRVMLVNNVDGKNDGEYAEYSPDGERVIHRLKLELGIPVGVEETFDPMSGKLTGQAQYVNGKLQGTVRRWDAGGKLIYEREFQNGEMLRSNDVVTECTSNRAQAYERATGQHEEPTQRDVWDASCREQLRLASKLTTQEAK